MRSISNYYRFLESNSLWFLLAGMGLSVVINALAWRKDRRRLDEVNSREETIDPLPTSLQVSFLIPAWCESQNLAACIKSILGLSYQNKQLIVCAGGMDGTLELARQYESEHVIVLPQGTDDGKQGALRRSYKKANGDIIYLTDADCVLDDECFERTLQPIVEEGEGVVTGAWRPLDRQIDSPFVQYQWAHHIYRELLMPEYTTTLDGRNTAVRRPILEETGGFAVDAPIGTDYVLSRQLTSLGYRIRFVRHSHVQTEYPEKIPAFWRQQSRWIRNRLLLGREWKDQGSVLVVVRGGVPSAFLLAVPTMGGLNNRLLRATWLSLVCHLVLSACRFTQMLRLSQGSSLSQHCSFRLVLYLPVGWVAMCLGLVESIIPERRTIW